MADIFNYKENQPIVWFHRMIERSNQHCLYCGIYLGLNSGRASNKEHLIGREFVPSEYYQSTDFNFIFRCCIECNTKKSNIERHLSTLTLLNSDSRLEDAKINELALRKANKDYHPNNKGVLVIDSNIQREIEFGDSIIRTKVGFVGPPQYKEDYVVELAFRHIQGLFSLLSSKNPLVSESTKLLSSEYFNVIGIYPKNDWGNKQIEYCVSKTECWRSCCNIVVANGYFRALILQSTQESEELFWALEWNKSIRILGAICDESSFNNSYADMPELLWSPWIKNSTGEYRFFAQTPLGSSSDRLFRKGD